MILTKASVFLRVVGQTSSPFFTVSDGGSVSFDASNFSELEQGNPSAVFEITGSGYYGNGYMSIGSSSGNSWPTLTYPIVCETAGKYTLFLRVKAEDTFSFALLINGISVNDVIASVPSNQWIWISTTFVAVDGRQFSLSIIPKTKNCCIDSLHITTQEFSPTTVEYQSRFLTLHFKMYEVDDNFTPDAPLPIYGYKTSIEEIVDDNWYNFVLGPLPGHSSINFTAHYATALLSSGGSDSLYFMWDYADSTNELLDPYFSSCSLVYNSNSQIWELDCVNRYALRLYSFRDAIDETACKIVVPASALVTKTTKIFSTESIEPVFINTKAVPNEADTEKVELSLPDRLVSVVMDQSGSMTWNDSGGLRHEVTRRMIDRLQATYPGTVRYNLLSLGSTPIKINFFAVVETDQVNTNDTSEVASDFFADQESGYAGVRIIRKKGSFPTGPLDGEIVTEGFIERAFDDDLLESQPYYYGAYTFNSAGIFSEGTLLSATPAVKVIPRGVGGFTYRIIAGTGVRRDANTIGIWHLNESTGFMGYDFSNNPLNLSSDTDDLVWLNSFDVPTGISGIRFNGHDTRLVGYDESGKFIATKYTFMAWIYPFDFNANRTIVSRELTNQNKLSFRFGTNTNGKLTFTMDEAVIAVSSGTLTANEWNHVAVTVDTETLSASFYINGHLAGSGSITLLGAYSPQPMNIYLGGKTGSFFGKISEVSIHNSIRSASYILSEAYFPVLTTDKVLDNGDRIVAIKYVVADDFNYAGGQIRIVRKQDIGTAKFEYVTPPNGGSPQLTFKGFGTPPSHENDGDIVFQADAEPGSFSVVLPYDYVHGRTYHFRIYSQNTLGNYSLASDSPVLSIPIPVFSSKDARNAAITTPMVSKPTNVQALPGNNKNYLTWDLPIDTDVHQVLVYWSDTSYPIVNNDQGIDSSAILVFSGNPSDTSFVDRNIENESTSYYAVLFADRYGNLSEPAYVSSIPQTTADESTFPLLEVGSFRYELVNENAISLAWEAPVKFQRDIQGWFDQRIALFAQITDELGAPIADASNISFTAKASVQSAQLAEDVFGEVINTTTSTPEAQNCFVLSSTSIGNGFLRGVFRMTTDPDTLSAINSLTADITVSYNIPDRDNPDTNVFEFTSLPLHIETFNPFSMQLLNIGDNTSYFGDATQNGLTKKSKRRRGHGSSTVEPTAANSTSGDTVKVLCKQTVPLDDQEFISSGGAFFDPDKFKEFPGCWIRRTRPFVGRVVVSYRGGALPVGSSCNAAVFEANDPQCDKDQNPSNPCSQSGGGGDSAPPEFIPSFSGRRSRSVQPPATSIPLRTGTQRLTDGTTRQVSYADIPLKAPRSPQAIMLFAKTLFNGYFARKKMYVVFDNILRVETTIEAPESNCIDISEQQANIYLIDPDSPNVEEPIKVPIVGQQIVRWDLRKGRNAKDRPFYSTDNVPSGPGVFSYTRSGHSRKIFFGPACGVTWETYIPCPGNVILLPELYAIKASVVYDGLHAFEERPAIIYPPGDVRGFGSRFLMEMPQYVNTLVADGYDLARVKIYHDPTISGGQLADCFIQCATAANMPIFTLDNGQLIDIEPGEEFEILYGDNLQVTYDENLDEYVITEATQNVAFAQIPLAQSGSSTTFYLRINKFIGKPQTATNNNQNDDPAQSANLCSCIEIPPGLLAKNNLKTVRGRTSVIFNGQTRYLNGGGDLRNGVPPTTIELREPLSISVVDIRRNGESVEKILCNGVAIHEFVLEVSFKDKAVPNGTPVFLTIGGNNPEKIILQNDTIYTNKVNDRLLNPNGPEKSYASFFVAPFGPESAFEAQVQAETNYDKRGDVLRSMTACVEIKYDPSQPNNDVETEDPQGQINNVFSADLHVYDTYTDTWTKKTGMAHPRGCLTLNWTFDAYSEQLFAIGGLNGKSILAYNEMYDFATDTWTPKKAMPTPRFYHMSIQDANYIYVFGGIVADGTSLAITQSVERYNTITDTWETMPSMPMFDQNPYGVALGACCRINNKAYIVCGIRKIGESGGIDALNDRVLVFDLDTHTWTYSDAFTGTELTLYSRISPFLFADANQLSLRILGGAIPGVRNDDGSQPLDFVTDTIKISLSSLDLSQDDFIYGDIPAPRYRGGYASIVDHHYFLGGTSSKSQVLNAVEQIAEGTPIYDLDVLTKLPVAKTAFGTSSDQWRYLYTAGGLTSGRPEGFLQIQARANPQSIRLDGQQSTTVVIELVNDVGEHPTQSVRVLVQGILLFPNAQIDSVSGGDQSQQQASDQALRDALVYPVVFSSNDFYIQNGVGSTIMLPRSDDILRKISEIKRKLGIEDRVTGEGTEADKTLKIKEGDIRNPYKIRVRITVIDDFFYGQTVLDVKDNQSDTTPIVTPTSTDSTSSGSSSGSSGSSSGSTGSGVHFEGCRSVEGSQSVPASQNTTQQPGRDSENNQTIDQGLKQSSNPVFDLSPPQTPQLDSPEIAYFSDIEWIPQIIVHVNNDGYETVVKYLNRLSGEIPFGASPLYDAIIKNASLMLDDSLDIYAKVIYVNTDNEENLSVNTLDSTIEEVQAIDGFGKVPVIMNNFSVVFPVTLSALVARTDTDSLDRISLATGGQSQTVLDATFVDEVVNNSLGRVAGSVGWGLYQCVIDLDKSSIINDILLEYELFDNTEGSWKLATSDDGVNYSDYSDSFKSNTQVEFSKVSARYLRFQVTLLTGLSASITSEYDLIPTPGVPALAAIYITYSLPTESFIYLNPDTLSYSPQQISVAVSANQPLLSQIEVGATTSRSYNWSDYKSNAQPPSDRFGKVFIPIRYSQTEDKTLNEPLENIDGYMWKAKYGRWDNTSAVVITDSEETILDPSLYQAYPQEGVIVFGSRQIGPLFISVENAGRLKLGVRVLNMDSQNSVAIDGLGYMYNTNVFLPPPLSARPPVVNSLRINPSLVTIYQTMGLTYTYIDLNQKDEDTTKSEIRWYINGVEIEYLRNLRTWNNIQDFTDPIWIYAFTFKPTDVTAGTSIEEFARQRQESILKVNDVLYVTVRASDGTLFSQVVRSPSITISEAPPFVSRLAIKGKKNDGSVQDKLTTATRAFADFDYFQDGNSSAKSQIVWYVNGREFKRGDLNAVVGGFSNNEILTGEIRNNVIAIAIGNVLEVTILPASQNIIGNPITSAAVSVENDPPTVRNVIVSPNPSAPSSSSLQLSYTYVDVDSQQQGSTQNDQSSIRWLRAPRNSMEFAEVAALQNQRIVSAINTSSGEQWKAEVVPFDGLSVGVAVQSNIVTIS